MTRVLYDWAKNPKLVQSLKYRYEYPAQGIYTKHGTILEWMLMTVTLFSVTFFVLADKSIAMNQFVENKALDRIF